MKKFIILVVAFILFTVAIYIIALPIWVKFTSKEFKPNIRYELGGYGHMYSRMKDLDKSYNEIDVLFLGSSHAYRGFDIRNFKDINCFILGSSSQTPIQTKYLLDRYLEKINPKLIILEVFPANFSSDGVESSVDIISNDKFNLDILSMAMKVNNIIVYNTLTYSIYQDILSRKDNFIEYPVKKNDLYIKGGFVERKNTFYKNSNIEQAKEWKINIKQLRNFNRIINTIKDKKIPLILVYTPVTKSFYNSYKNNSYFDSLMNGYNLNYYNYNNIEKFLDDSLHFYDDHHLNQDGVNIFNKIFRETLYKNIPE